MIRVRVFKTASPQAAAALARATRLLAPEERARAAEFAVPHAAEAFTLGRVMLREAMSEAFGGDPAAWRFVAGASGKPALVAGGRAGFDFNLTHTHGLVAVAAGDCAAIGVDAENLDRENDVMRVARRFFADGEIAAIERIADAAARRRRVLHLWTLKESWLKATGAGIAGTLKAARFDFEREPTAELRDDVAAATLPTSAGDGWRFRIAEVDARWSVSVAVREASDDPMDFRVL